MDYEKKLKSISWLEKYMYIYNYYCMFCTNSVIDDTIIIYVTYITIIVSFCIRK